MSRGSRSQTNCKGESSVGEWHRRGRATIVGEIDSCGELDGTGRDELKKEGSVQLLSC